MSSWKILIKWKKHSEHHEKISIRSIAVHYKENSRFVACSIYLFLVYKIVTSTIESRRINKYTQKSLGLLLGLSNVTLYCKQAKLKLPFKSIVEEFKSGKIRLQMILDDSKDKVIKSLNPPLKTGKKWKVRDTIRSAKVNLAFKETVGHTQTGRQGLGMEEKQQWSKTISKNHQDMVIQDVKSEVDNNKFLKEIQQFQQGQWTNWEETLQKSIGMTSSRWLLSGWVF